MGNEPSVDGSGFAGVCEVVGNQSGLRVGGVLELDGVGYVPEGPYAIGRGPQLVVGDHVALIIGGDTAKTDRGQVTVRDPTGSYQKLVGVEGRAVREVQVEGLAGCSVGVLADSRDGGFQMQVHTVCVDLGEAASDVVVGAPQQMIAPVDDGDPTTQPLKHVSHLHGDEAST